MFVKTEERPQGEQPQSDLLTLEINKLSMAIRVGCKIAPRQISGIYADRSGGACAIGAAMLAMGADPFDYMAWPTMKYRLDVPLGFHGEVTQRNDKGESREAIADWLESKGQ